jgi:serine kinase of HPr protein (carbohydrate metabolism regulator)
VSGGADPGVVMVHATAIAVGGRAALIRGPSGSGKSDLALRCLALPATGALTAGAHAAGALAASAEPVLLVADDVVMLAPASDGESILASCPPAIVGLLEVRGIGIVPVRHVTGARLAAVFDIVAADVAIERLPEPEVVHWFGIAVPRYAIHAFEASSAIKIRLGLEIGCGEAHTPRDQQRIPP